jgi:RNA polymerase sigma-70 factor (ECF subfamily)
MEDEKLVERIKNGDDTAFDELINAHKKKIYQMALSHTRNPEDAENLTQYIFAEVKSFLHSWQPQRVTFATWLYCVALNYIHKATRRKIYGCFSSQLKTYITSLN